MWPTASVVTVAPTWEPVQLDDVRQHMRVDITEDDALIVDLLRVARGLVEAHLGQTLPQKTLETYSNCWPTGLVMRLPGGPLRSVTAIDYFEHDAPTTPVTWADTNYQVGQAGVGPVGLVTLVAGAFWPISILRPSQGIRVTWVAGYTKPSAIADEILHAIRLTATHFYEHREEVVMGAGAQHLPMGVKALLATHRAYGSF